MNVQKADNLQDLKRVISLYAIVALLAHAAYPKLNINALSVGLLVLAFLPWLPSRKRSIMFPGAGRRFHFAFRPRLLAVAAIVALLYIPFLQMFAWGFRNPVNSDLPSFYCASVQVFGKGGSPYDPAALQLLMEQVNNNVHVFPYLYPPWSLVFSYPLHWVDYVTAWKLVLVGNHLIILALLFVIPLLLLRVPPGRRLSLVFPLTCVYILRFYPTVGVLENGQVNLLLLSFLLAFWLLARAKHSLAASIFLALAILLKTYPLVILPLLFISGRKRECIYTVMWVGLGALGSLLILPPGIWQDWFYNILPQGGYMNTPEGLFSPAAIWNQGFNGFFARLLTPSQWSTPLFVDVGLARLLAYASAGLLLVFSGIAVFRGSGMNNDNLDRTLMVALPVMYLVSPFSWEHHLIYLIPPILILLTSVPNFPTVQKILFQLTIITVAFLIGLDQGRGYKFYYVFILWVLCIITASSGRVQLQNSGLKGKG